MAKIKEKINYTFDVQLLLIATMVNNGELFVRCQNIIKPQYFDLDLQRVVKFIIEHCNKFNGMPSLELIKAETNVDIPKVVTNESHSNWFLETIELFCRHKAIELAILTSADMISEGYYGEVEKLVKDAVLISLNKDLGTSFFETPRETLEKLLKQNGSISTGWKTVDNAIYNLGKGELALFAAVTGGGKSVALQNLAINWALQNFNVIYFTFELSEELVLKRLASMISGIPNSSIFRQLDQVELVVKQKGKTSGRIQIKYMKQGANTNDIKAYLKEYQIKTNIKPDMILVDYLDLMHPNSRKIDVTNLFAKDKLVAEELRGLAAENEIVAASAAQINRQGYDNLTPNAANIAGGISKAYTADVVINVNLTPGSREKGEIQFHFMKTRNSGGVGSDIVLKYDPNTLRISDNDESSQSQINNRFAQKITNASHSQVELDNTASQSVQTKLIENSAQLPAALQRLLNKTKT